MMNMLQKIFWFFFGIGGVSKPKSPMKTSDKGIDFITRLEGVVLKIYQDEEGLPTIGIGHYIQNPDDLIKFKDGITLQQAQDLLKSDLGDVERVINKYITIPLMQTEFDSLASLIFNIGDGGFIESTVLKEIDLIAPETDVEMWWKAWDKVVINGVKQVSMNLMARRQAEWNLYSQGIYL